MYGIFFIISLQLYHDYANEREFSLLGISPLYSYPHICRRSTNYKIEFIYLSAHKVYENGHKIFLLFNYNIDNQLYMNWHSFGFTKPKSEIKDE